MRIVQMFSAYNRWIGGTEHVCLDYYRALRSRGHEVITLLHPKSLIVPTLKTLAGKKNVFTHHQRLLPPDYIGQWQLTRLLKQLSPDIIITHVGRDLLLLEQHKPHYPILAVNHGFNPKRTIGCRGVIAINQTIGQETASKAGIPSNRIFTIPHMVAIPDTVQPEPDCSVPVIGAFGRLAPEKGFDLLIDAAYLLRKQQLPFHLLIGGDGPERKRLEMLVRHYHLEDQVSFYGWVGDKQAFFNRVNLVCIPSRMESFGIVILEAFAHGKAVVSADNDGPKEIISHNMNGLLVIKNNPHQLAAAITRLLTQPELRTALAQHAYNTAFSYSPQTVGAYIERAISTCIEDA